MRNTQVCTFFCCCLHGIQTHIKLLFICTWSHLSNHAAFFRKENNRLKISELIRNPFAYHIFCRSANKKTFCFVHGYLILSFRFFWHLCVIFLVHYCQEKKRLVSWMIFQVADSFLPARWTSGFQGSVFKPFDITCGWGLWQLDKYCCSVSP